jgi:hypothetical protein
MASNRSSTSRSTSAHLPSEPILDCRICGSSDLDSAIDLGDQAFTGRFPKAGGPDEPRGPLAIVQCADCHFVQLSVRYDTTEFFGDEYGYRSGLNAGMVRHLQSKVQDLERRLGLHAGDVVLDIGSNDGTTLNAFRTAGLRRHGMDPTASKFREHYDPDVTVSPTLFSAERFLADTGGRRAGLITSLGMYYDLNDPIGFAREVKASLAPDGIWHAEQSYLPTMVGNNAFDTICHEHVSYFTIATIDDILSRSGLRIVDVGFNDVNGGSFHFEATHAESAMSLRNDQSSRIARVRRDETAAGFDTLSPLLELGGRVRRGCDALVEMLERLRAKGDRVVGYGASTKGNVLLQYAGIGPDLMQAIGEVNPNKFGCRTPGTGIPIVSDQEARALDPTHFLVLPWHFREEILPRETEFRARGGRFIFPLPELDVV